MHLALSLPPSLSVMLASEKLTALDEPGGWATR